MQLQGSGNYLIHLNNLASLRYNFSPQYRTWRSRQGTLSGVGYLQNKDSVIKGQVTPRSVQGIITHKCTHEFTAVRCPNDVGPPLGHPGAVTATRRTPASPVSFPYMVPIPHCGNDPCALYYQGKFRIARFWSRLSSEYTVRSTCMRYGKLVLDLVA